MRKFSLITNNKKKGSHQLSKTAYVRDRRWKKYN